MGRRRFCWIQGGAYFSFAVVLSSDWDRDLSGTIEVNASASFTLDQGNTSDREVLIIAQPGGVQNLFETVTSEDLLFQGKLRTNSALEPSGANSVGRQSIQITGVNSVVIDYEITYEVVARSGNSTTRFFLSLRKVDGSETTTLFSELFGVVGATDPRTPPFTEVRTGSISGSL